jgi:hypothetical protein
LLATTVYIDRVHRIICVHYAHKLIDPSLAVQTIRETYLRNITYSYRFADEVLNAKLALKKEIESVLSSQTIDIHALSRPNFNEVLRKAFVERGWEDQPAVFDEEGDPSARMDFLKERIGIEVEFGHSSFLGIDLLKFQVASYSGINKIDIGVYIVTTREFQKHMKTHHNQNWEGSLTFEKVVKYLPHFKSAIQIPIFVIGIDI